MGTRRWRQALAVGLGLIGMAMLAAGGLRVEAHPARALVDCDVVDYSNDGEEMAFLSLVNAYRGQNGLGPLTVNPTLNRTATWMVHDMGANNSFSHTDSLGRSAYKRATDCGYPGGAGENLAGGSAWDSAQETFDAWAASPGHNANMLGGYYTEIGIARANVPGSSYGWYWATEFGAGSGGGGASPTSTPTKTATPTTTPTNTPTPTSVLPGSPPSSTPSPATPSNTPAPTPAGSSTGTATPTATKTSAATATPTIAGATPANTPSPTKSAQATSTPTHAAPPAPTSLALRRGANLVAWPGADMAPAQAIKSAGASVSMVYRWDAATRRWQRYSPTLPGFANTLTTMRRGEAYWVIATGQAQVYVP